MRPKAAEHNAIKVINFTITTKLNEPIFVGYNPEQMAMSFRKK